MSTRHLFRALVAAPLLAPAGAAAQGRLAGGTESAIGPVFETWRFGGAGIAQPTADGASTVLVRSATQWSVPLSATIPLGSRLTVDVGGSYAHGEVQLASPDRALGTSRYTLSGPTDVRVRATGRVVGDNVLVTLGANVPTGKTSLAASELSALRVLGAPALSFQSPVLGTGGSGTVGLVLAREVAGWAFALGSSYELRSKYTPVVVAAGLPVDLSPGDVLHVSVGADGLVGRHGMTLGLSADVFGDDLLAMPAANGSPAASAASHLGPIFTGDWQLHLAADRFRELTLYAVDRYRTPFTRADIRSGSANYLDAGVRAVAALGQGTGLLVMVNGRHQTGLDTDVALSTAAVASGALTLGLAQDIGGAFSVQPFVRGQLGRLESGSNTTNVSGFSGGLSLRARF